MFNTFTQFIDNMLGRPPKANANDPYRRDHQARQQQKRRRLTPAEESAEATKQIEQLVGPVAEQSPMLVQRSPSPNPSFASSSNVRLAEQGMQNSTASNASPTGNPSGSTVTLTPNALQQNLAPGMVPVPSASSAQSSLRNFIQLMDRSGNLKYNAIELLTRCETLANLIHDMPPELKKTSRFISRVSEIDSNVRETTRYLEEWNKKNKYKQAVGKKDMYVRIAKLDKATRDYYQEITGIQSGLTLQQVTKLVEGVEPEENQVQEAEFVQHVKEVTGQDAPSTHILNKKIHHRENTTFASSNNFDLFKGELVEGREPVAIKIYREKIKMDQSCVKFVERMMRQVTLWTSFQDPSVLECYGIGMQVTKSSEQSFDRLQFYLVSPLLRHGNAVSYIAQRRRAGLYVNVLQIIRDAAVGIRFLHHQEKPCVHASMRGENILIRDNGMACINGFGLTKALSEKKPIELTGKNFQVRWMAPELLEQDRPRLLPSCDIWSWAMTALELFAGVPPYHNVESDYGVRDQIVKGCMPEETDYPDFNTYSPQPDMMWALLRKCWNRKPEERPTIDQIIDELDLINNAQVEKQRAEEPHQWA